MKRGDDGLPVVGSNSKELGVRVFPNPNADVDIAADGTVEHNGRGMSVAAHWADLLPHLIPKRMRPHSPGAAGSNALACYRTGQGEFSDGPLGRELALQLKPGQSRNGNIVPASRLTIDRFQLALAATRDEWTVDEAPA
jgi:hypothetical protein